MFLWLLLAFVPNQVVTAVRPHHSHFIHSDFYDTYTTAETDVFGSPRGVMEHLVILQNEAMNAVSDAFITGADSGKCLEDVLTISSAIDNRDQRVFDYFSHEESFYEPMCILAHLAVSILVRACKDGKVSDEAREVMANFSYGTSLTITELDMLFKAFTKEEPDCFEIFKADDYCTLQCFDSKPCTFMEWVCDINHNHGYFEGALHKQWEAKLYCIADFHYHESHETLGIYEMYPCDKILAIDIGQNGNMEHDEL